MQFNYAHHSPLFQSLEEIVTGAVAEAPAFIEDNGLIQDDGPVVDFNTLVNKEKPAEPKEPKKETPKEPAAPAEGADELDEYGLTKKEQLEARQLLAGLKDPSKAPVIIDVLTQGMGYTRAETKKEAVAQAKAITEELAEALGPELKYVADKMGPIIEKHIKSQVDQVKLESSNRITAIELEKHQNAAAKDYAELNKEYFGEGEIPDNLAKEMSKIMETHKADGSQTAKDYMKDVMFMAAGRIGVEVKKQGKPNTPKVNLTERTERNRNDAPSRLASDGSKQPKAGEVAIHPTRQMSLKDSISKAMQDVATSMEK